jgi:hypothetical protein
MLSLNELIEKENYFFRHGMPMEGDWILNKIQRAKIRAMRREYGHAWLGRINIYKDWNQDHYQKRYSRGMVYNFQYDYLLPGYNKEIENLVRAYNDISSLINSSILFTKIEEILEKISARGGQILTWV